MDIIDAAQYAAKQHAGQFRKWGHSHIPYIRHPMRVAGMVMLADGGWDELVKAAWLHDVIEDCPVTYNDLEAEFGSLIADLVEELTNTSKLDAGLDRAGRKAVDRAHTASISRDGKLIKLADRLDNIQEVLDDDQVPRKWLQKYLDESLLLLDEALMGIDSRMEDELRGLLTKGQRRLAPAV